MKQLLQALVKNCELVFRQEGWGFHLTAKGPIAVLAAAAIIAVLARQI
jgi:hypothetical protein